MILLYYYCFFFFWAELMVLGFISLLLTFGQNYIASLCVASKYGNAMSFCGPYDGPSGDTKKVKDTDHMQRHLLSLHRRVLAGGAPAECKKVTHLSLLTLCLIITKDSLC